MKIAQVVCVFPPYRGGIGMMAYHHALALSKAGHEVVVFTPNFQENKSQEMEQDGFKVKRLKPWFVFGNSAFCPELLKHLRDFDVVHLHYPCFGLAELVWWKKKQKPFNLVLTYHMDVVGGVFKKFFFKIHSWLLMPKIIKSAEKIIVTSNDYAAHSDISRIFYRRPNTFVEIPPEVDVERFRPGLPVEDLQKKLGIDPDKDKVLLFVGGLDRAHYFKGLKFLFKSFNLLKDSGQHSDLKLVIVGDGDLKEDYQREVEKLGLEDKVCFVGQVSSQDLPRYYNLADLFVLPSIDKSEAFGLVIIEAMACGTPVVASNLPGVRTALKGAGLVFELGNEGDLAAKLNALLSNPQELKRLGQEGRRLAKEKYAPSIIIEKLLKVYEGLFD